MSSSSTSSRKRTSSQIEICECVSKRHRLISILDFPDEILVEIFSKLPRNDLLSNVRLVCGRFQYLVWDNRFTLTKIIANGSLSTRTLRKQIIFEAPFLKHLILKERKDLGKILPAVSRKCRKLESLEIVKCRSTPECRIIHGIYLCNILNACQQLRSIRMEQVRVGGRLQFFQMLNRTMKRGNRFGWSYNGPIWMSELHILLQSQRTIPTPRNYIKLNYKNGEFKIGV